MRLELPVRHPRRHEQKLNVQTQAINRTSDGGSCQSVASAPRPLDTTNSQERSHKYILPTQMPRARCFRPPFLAGRGPAAVEGGPRRRSGARRHPAGPKPLARPANQTIAPLQTAVAASDAGSTPKPARASQAYLALGSTNSRRKAPAMRTGASRRGPRRSRAQAPRRDVGLHMEPGESVRLPASDPRVLSDSERRS